MSKIPDQNSRGVDPAPSGTTFLDTHPYTPSRCGAERLLLLLLVLSSASLPLGDIYKYKSLFRMFARSLLRQTTAFKPTTTTFNRSFHTTLTRMGVQVEVCFFGFILAAFCEQECLYRNFLLMYFSASRLSLPETVRTSPRRATPSPCTVSRITQTSTQKVLQ
jgi:hypothetical protein